MPRSAYCRCEKQFMIPTRESPAEIVNMASCPLLHTVCREVVPALGTESVWIMETCESLASLHGRGESRLL